MYTNAALLDIHERTHRNFSALLVHCGALSASKLRQELPGFGVPTVHQQLHHAIGAEEYWVSVLKGNAAFDENVEKHPTTESLEAYRATVFAETSRVIAEIPEADLDQVRGMIAWDGKERQLSPAQGILRTQTHFYHHQGQVLAMCRILGHPGGGFDFPLG